MYAFTFGRSEGAVLIFRFDKPDAAIERLQAAGINVVDSVELARPDRRMSLSRAIAEQMERASWIRRMFEIGARMKAERGAENVFDFTLGNPEVEPPARVLAVLPPPGRGERAASHGYMPNAGFPEVRATVARRLERPPAFRTRPATSS